jgi:hypothetical protein
LRVRSYPKSGTQQFRGSGYYYFRHEKLNANDFFENAAGRPKSRYRYNTVGGTLGGPVHVANFNESKNKLFFEVGVRDRSLKPIRDAQQRPQ